MQIRGPHPGRGKGNSASLPYLALLHGFNYQTKAGDTEAAVQRTVADQWRIDEGATVAAVEAQAATEARLLSSEDQWMIKSLTPTAML